LVITALCGRECEKPDYLQSPTKNDHCPLPLLLRTWCRFAVCIDPLAFMNVSRQNFLHLAAGAALLPAATRIARAQAYATQPMHIILPFAPAYNCLRV
jgi:hypothetical protein